MFFLQKKNTFYFVAFLFLLIINNSYALKNIALRGHAWASTESLPAANAIDGKSNTRWSSNTGIDPSWIAVDFGHPYQLSQVVIDWDAANAQIYELQVSNDAKKWETLAIKTGGTFGARTDIIEISGVYRYVRIYGTKRSAGNLLGYSIWELKIYGRDYPDPIPLFDSTTVLEPDTQLDTPTALVTRFADRARDRHAREDQFHAYDHYLSLYWEYRTAQIEIIDEVAKNGTRVLVNVRTEWPLRTTDFRAFYRGVNTVAEYWHNAAMRRDPNDPLKYSTIITTNPKERRALRIGDRMEIEVSQFLDSPPRGRSNYYGTAFLYIVGVGIVPWEARGVFGDPTTEREDSYPIPLNARLGGNTTVHHQYSAEPEEVFKQMATNTSNINGQLFMKGRRVHHTDFGTGAHSELPNPSFPELADKLGNRYINRSCVSCHQGNGRALPPSGTQILTTYTVKVADANGNPHPKLGSILQSQAKDGQPEGTIRIQSWSENNGLRTPNYLFTGPVPEKFSARITPQLVGLGLLEAVPESAIAELENTHHDNGIAGRINIVTDLTGIPRVGRFGWKAGKATLKDQVAAALNDDIGITTSLLPHLDCGSEQDCGENSITKLDDEYVDALVTYIALLGVRAQRDSENPLVKQGEQLFESTGCTGCHNPTFTTSAFHPNAELRNQVIHPYTDLLLHNMGPGLADSLSEGNASGAEWRTAPLWNIGLTAGVSMGEAYLHDGRARTLHEAIMWHGGEAESSRNAYANLSDELRNAVIQFLKSL
ncbi:TPA: di-heme oxidoredictase family protein [Legionella anisa]